MPLPSLQRGALVQVMLVSQEPSQYTDGFYLTVSVRFLALPNSYLSYGNGFRLKVVADDGGQWTGFRDTPAELDGWRL